MARPQERERSRIDLRELLEHSLTFLTEKLRTRGIRLETDLADGLTVEGDDEKLQQLFLNLFLNSADAMQDGGELRVRLVRTPKGDCEVCVEDTGHGMSPEVRARVFEPFFSTKQAGAGTGLGLMVAHGIARDHGGTIEVESEEGRGSKFCIVLPAAGPDEASSTPERAPRGADRSR